MSLEYYIGIFNKLNLECIDDIILDNKINLKG